MKPRSLVGRVAMVQVVTAVAMLVFVVAATLVAVTALLVNQRDHDLEAAATVIADELREAHSPGDVRVWLDRELDEHRPPGLRLEVRDGNGNVLGIAGEGPAFGTAGTGCTDRDTFRICAVRMDRLTITAGRSRQPGVEAQRRFAGALGAATAIAALVVLLIARRVTRKALAPLSSFADRAANIEPGTGMRIGGANGLEELERLGGRFDALIERFEEALARERRFAAEASHELRTPLTVLRAEVEALLARASDRPAVERALAAADRLLALVVALLWFSRAQGRLDDECMGIVNLADVVRAQTDRLRARYDNKNVQVAAPDEVLVRGDEHLIALAGTNLIENALKHGGAGPITVQIVADDDRAELKVTDRGPGIPSAVQGRIFEPFFRGGRARADTEGFGLGLPLARAVARAHGGDVKIASSSDTGSVFVLELPVVEAPSAAP